ncbi:MAG: vWA domain-containing protein [Adhaeribacter sp.]
MLFWLGAGLLSQAQAQPAPAPVKKTRILFLLDMSGSMFAKWENSTRSQVAKDILSRLVDSLAQYKNLDLALRVYGHQYVSGPSSCQDSKLEVPFAENNEKQIITRIAQITPKGNTPITYSLTQAAKDFPVDKNARNIIIIITDGLESCGGDPCAASLALQQKRIFLRPFVIGIGNDGAFAQQFSCVGQYFDAADINSFRNIMGEVVSIALSKTTVSVELKDGQGRPLETDVNLTFRNSITTLPEYNYVHYLDQARKPDVLEIDALMDYDLVVNTVPPVTLPRLQIRPGKHNVFSVPAPQGILYLRQDGPSQYGQVQTIVRQKDNSQTLLTLPFGSRQKLLAGTYDLEILTLPRIYQQVSLRSGLATTVTYPRPGILSIPNDLQGFGSIYLLHDNGEQEWVYNLPEASSKLNLPLQPGRYRLVYRTRFAKGSKYTDVQDFIIKSAATTSLRLFAR